jgi:GNAT superfamily N-acetyltransferase
MPVELQAAERGRRAGAGRAPWPDRALSLAYRAAQRLFVCDVSSLLVLELADLRPQVAEPEIDLRFLTAPEVADWGCDADNQLSPLFALRMQSGVDRCIGAVSGSKLLAYAWLATGSIEAEHNCGRARRSGVALSFPDATAFVYKGYTRPEARGLGLYTAILTSALLQLAPQGITRLITTAEWNNTAALAACRRLGFRKVGGIGRFGCGPLTCTCVPAGARRYDLRMGRQAHVIPRSVSASPWQTN